MSALFGLTSQDTTRCNAGGTPAAAPMYRHRHAKRRSSCLLDIGSTKPVALHGTSGSYEEQELAANLKRVRIAPHPAQIRLSTDFNECADLRNAGVLRWKWMAGRLKFRAEIAFPGLTGRGGVRSPAAFVFIVPRAYPNKPPTVFMWDETSHSPGPQLTKDQLPIVAPSSWVPVLSIRDVVLAIADKFYDAAKVPAAMRANFPRGPCVAVAPAPAPPRRGNRGAGWRGAGASDSTRTSGAGAGAGAGSVASAVARSLHRGAASGSVGSPVSPAGHPAWNAVAAAVGAPTVQADTPAAVPALPWRSGGVVAQPTCANATVAYTGSPGGSGWRKAQPAPGLRTQGLAASLWQHSQCTPGASSPVEAATLAGSGRPSSAPLMNPVGLATGGEPHGDRDDDDGML